MTAEIYVGLLILLVFLFFVLRPLWQAHHSRPHVAAPTEADLRLENLLFQRETVLQGLRDLQMDRQSGKLTEEEFSDLDAQLRAEAVDVLRQLDQMGEVVLPASGDEASLDQWIEQAVAEVRARPRGALDVAPPRTDQQRSEPA